MKTPCIIILREEHFPLARKISALMQAEIHSYRPRCKEGDIFFDEVAAHLQSLFLLGHPIIGICASGILIRALAPLIKDKQEEPPVLSLADDGSSVIPLLGGHHGANGMARKIAQSFSSHAAITTSGDLAWQMALDEPPEGLTLSNPQNAKHIMGELLSGKGAQIVFAAGKEFTGWFQNLPKGDDFTFMVSEKRSAKADLLYRPKTIVLGIGCERNVETREVIALAEQSLQRADIDRDSIAAIVSIDIKSDEPALHEAADYFHVPIRFFSKDEINEHKERLATPSDTVFTEVGVYGVAEGAALAAVGRDGALISPKKKSARATCAIAKSSHVPDLSKTGRKRGKLYILGIGPGRADWRVSEAERVLRDAEEWVGYKLYLDLLPDLGKRRHDFALGEEEARVHHALSLAASGKDIALVSSGDAGIYAMASLVYELIDRHKEWQRLDVHMVPGISAMQAAAARIGAPLGHDFCTISLSDLLTSWSVIENRIKAAAKGDFVIAFYNPVSIKRDWQLRNAQEILLQERASSTPVLIARNLGREEERLHITDLGNLDPEMVDMLSLVMIGNSQSKVFKTADGRQFFYTPRGYAAKVKALAS